MSVVLKGLEYLVEVLVVDIQLVLLCLYVLYCLLVHVRVIVFRVNAEDVPVGVLHAVAGQQPYIFEVEVTWLLLLQILVAEYDREVFLELGYQVLDDGLDSLLW